MSSGPQPFLIANPRVGIERDMESWLLPNDAYPQLEDCYLWRGRIKKKQGFQLLNRLQRKIATTNASGNISFILPNFPLTAGLTHLVIGTDFFQDIGTGTLITNGAAIVKTLVLGTGALTITNSLALTDVFYFPGLPVMGLPTLETITFNQGLLMAFDTSFSYQFNTTSKVFIDTSFYKGTTTLVMWTGTDSQFFWTTNYANAMWTTNDVAGFNANPIATTAASGDGIRWFDQDSSGWVNFLPPIDSTNFLMGALCLLPYKGRLLAFNTTEGTSFATAKRYPQRVRFSENGTPFYNSTIPTNYNGGNVPNAWRSDLVGFGGFIDAPTLEVIVSVQFVKDTIIVYFENSTWQLAYTGFEQLPFIWVKINTELGAVSTFSEVPFDKVVLGVGNVGIHACDSVNVQRIDQKIPDEAFSIQNENAGRQRVYGIRDFYNQLVYWTLPYVGSDQQDAMDDEQALVPPYGLIYPNRMLVYNYVDQSYSFFINSFTCFGYYQKANDTLWSEVGTEWQATRFTWFSPTAQALFPFIVAGNQQGFVEILDPEQTVNGDSLFIENITPGTPETTLTIPNHNLTVGQFIKITSASGITGLTTNLLSPNGIYEVFSTLDADIIQINTIVAPTGTFTGNGSLSTINRFNVITKRFNPFVEEAAQVQFNYADFFVDSTVNGQITINLYIDEDSSIPINSVNTLEPPINILNTFPETTYQLDDDTTPFVNSKIWKRMYFTDISQFFQMQLTLSNEQLLDDDVNQSDIVIHAMILYFSKAGRLINV